MTDRYIAFDVETPNHMNNRISAIGITVVEAGEIIQEIYSLVNPESSFDSFNIALTGITPEMVAEAPTFPQLWEQIEPVMRSGLLLAHNAQFDMSVLAKCLHFYNIAWRPSADYACTCTMGRVCYPDTENHRLNTLCDRLNIELDHHNAGSDSSACAKLLLDYLGCGICIEDHIRSYDFTRIRTVPRQKRTRNQKQKHSVQYKTERF